MNRRVNPLWRCSTVLVSTVLSACATTLSFDPAKIESKSLYKYNNELFVAGDHSQYNRTVHSIDGVVSEVGQKYNNRTPIKVTLSGVDNKSVWVVGPMSNATAFSQVGVKIRVVGFTDDIRSNVELWSQVQANYMMYAVCIVNFDLQVMGGATESCNNWAKGDSIEGLLDEAYSPQVFLY